MQLAFRILDLAARLLLALGAGCLLLGAYLLSRTLAFSGETVHTSGTVVAYHEIRDGADTRFRPRVRFRTPSGEIVTFAGQLSSSTHRFPVGAEVPVAYPRERPTQARVALFADNWLGPLVAGVVGVVSLVAGIFIRRGARRGASTGA